LIVAATEQAPMENIQHDVLFWDKIQSCCNPSARATSRGEELATTTHTHQPSPHTHTQETLTTRLLRGNKSTTAGVAAILHSRVVSKQRVGNS